ERQQVRSKHPYLLSSPGSISTANSIRRACMDHGFFYLVNHGVEEELFKEVFEQSSMFFALPVEEKMKLAKKNHRGYTALCAEKLDASLNTKGDSKESFYIIPLADHLNQWPLEAAMYCMKICHLGEAQWRLYHKKVLCARTRLVSLIALDLKLDEDFFEKVGAPKEPMAFIRILHYPGDLDSSSEEIYGASAHSDYGMITLLVTDGVPGLQACFLSIICNP
ncbi:hypothetical protein QUC31_016863, partial [Theobroma cacao]